MTRQSTPAPKAAGIRQRDTDGGTAASGRLKKGSEAARAASRKAVEGVESFPVAALVGGLAIGAVMGALLPRTRQEEGLFGSLGGTINEKAKDAAAAAREAGQSKLEELGINTDAAGKQVGKLIESITKIAESAGSAAIDAVRR